MSIIKYRIVSDDLLMKLSVIVLFAKSSALSDITAWLFNQNHLLQLVLRTMTSLQANLTHIHYNTSYPKVCVSMLGNTGEHYPGAPEEKDQRLENGTFFNNGHTAVFKYHDKLMFSLLNIWCSKLM